MKAELYYDDANGVYTKDKSYIPVYRGPNEYIFIECWWVDKDKRLCIDFAFTGGYNKRGLYFEREAHFKRFNVEPRFLRKLTLPKGFYDEMKKRVFGKEVKE